MEGDAITNKTVEAIALEDGNKTAEGEEEEVIIWESRMQEVELKYALLQQSHMDLQTVCDEQQRTIDQLKQQQQQQQQQNVSYGERSDKEEIEATFQRVLEKERSERLNTEEQKTLIQERLDRVLGENDLLREELSRSHQSNTHLSTQMQQVELESKMATSSQIPLRFRLERAEQGNRELTAQCQWLENEMTTVREEYEFKLQQKADLLHAERQKVAKMVSEEADRHTHVLSSHQEKLHKISAEHQQALLNLQNDHSQQIQSLQQALLAEQNLNRLHQANQEEKQHKIDLLQQSLLTMQSMAQSAEEEQKQIQSRLVEEHNATLEQIQEQRAQEVSNFQQQIQSLQTQVTSIEQRNVRRERRRAAAAAPLLTDGNTTVVVDEESTNMVVVPSLTDLIDRLADTEDQLKDEIDERRRVELILAKTQWEIEARTPLLRAQRQQYEQAIQLQQDSQRQLEHITLQYQQYLQLYEESRYDYQHLQNQLKLMQRENQDLARQIQSLLKSRLGESTDKADGAVTDGLMVEFESIEELQQQNQCLIRDHRQLTDRIKILEEQLDHDNLTKQLESATQEVNQLREERNQQEIIAKSIVQQRDMYRDMCTKATASEETNPAINTTAPLEEHRLQHEDNSKLQGDLAHLRNENQALLERVKRLDAYAADVVTTLNQIQGELISSQSLCARSQAEADFYNKQCDRYKESLEAAQSETKHIQNARTELQNIQSDLEQSLTQAREEIAKLEQLAIRKNSQVRLLEGQLEASQHAEQRLLAEVESARMELGRQGSLIESVHRIESSLIARNAEQQQQQLEEIERQRKNMTQENLKQAAELERLQRIFEETEEKKSSAEIARDKAIQEGLKAKESAVDAAQKLLDVQSKADNLEEKCEYLERELATTKGRLEAISLSSSDKVKDATIENLSAELETTKSKLADAKERVLIYQKVAKDNEKSLAELTSSYDAYKGTITEELERLNKELTLSNSAAEAKQAALDELSEELTNQRGSQMEEIDQLKQKNITITRQLENSKDDLQATVKKLSSVEEEINLHKANAFAARSNYERELALHSEARAELRSLRLEKDQESSFRKAAESRLELLNSEFQGERERYEDQVLKHEQQLFEVQSRLKETKEQNELLHSQVTSLANSLERKRSEQMDHLETAGENAEAGEITLKDDAEVNQLRATVGELREVISSMRSERELLDAQADVLKQALERERASSSVVRRSLDECRQEIRILREASQEAGKDDEFIDLRARLKVAEEQSVLLRESNILLREESDKLKSSLSVCEKSLLDAQNALEPTMKKIRDLEVANSSLIAEKDIIARDADAWKGRVQSLVARFHPIDPEEHSKAVARAERSEKDSETWKSLKAKAEQETAASKALIVRLNREVSQYKENLESTSQALSTLKAEKDAITKDLNEMQASSVSNTDNLNKLIRLKEEEMESIKSDLNLKNNRLENLTSILRRQKQMLADSQTTQAALQKKVEDQEALIKSQVNASAQNHNHSIEIIMNKESEALPTNQADIEPNVEMAQASIMKEMGSNSIQDAVVSIQESDERDVMNESVLTEAKKDNISDQTTVGFESKTIPASKTDIEASNEVSSQPVTQASFKKPEAVEKEVQQKDDDLSSAAAKLQSISDQQNEALESLRGKLLKKKRALEAKVASKARPQSASATADTIPTQSATADAIPTQSATTDIEEVDSPSLPVVTDDIPSEKNGLKGKNDNGLPDLLPIGTTMSDTVLQAPSPPLFGSKSDEEFRAAPISFGTSPTITLPIPSKLSASPATFGGYSGAFVGAAPMALNPFGKGVTSTVPNPFAGTVIPSAPLFSETKKRSQPDHIEDDEENLSAKQARLEVEGAEKQDSIISEVQPNI